MPDFLTNMDWSSPTTIIIGVAAIAVIAVAGYLFWAWSEGNWPFGQ
ncbi:MAG: hypothetical protein U9O55_04310 [Patescibacteria group bacterium]|nr:hypothetical protein [Patescibacteria group bacterium]